MEENAQQIAHQAIMAFFQRDKQDKQVRYHHLNKLVKKGQILFCGSSLMEQFPIYELMLNRDLPYTIYNRGIGGFTTSEMLEALEPCVLELEPEYIFINIGTNDLNGPDASVPALIKNYEEILNRIRARLPEAKFFLLAYYPVNDEVGLRNPMGEVFKYRTNALLNEANEAVRQLAERFGATFLDVNDGIKDENGRMKEEYTIEGMHMYGDGYDRVLEALLPVLENLD